MALALRDRRTRVSLPGILLAVGAATAVLFGVVLLLCPDFPRTPLIAAPMIRGTVRNGTLRFSVDCDRTEAQMLVDGLNNVAVKLKNRPKIKSDPDSTAKGASKKSPVNSKSAAADLINQNTRP